MPSGFSSSATIWSAVPRPWLLKMVAPERRATRNQVLERGSVAHVLASCTDCASRGPGIWWQRIAQWHCRSHQQQALRSWLIYPTPMSTCQPGGGLAQHMRMPWKAAARNSRAGGSFTRRMCGPLKSSLSVNRTWMRPSWHDPCSSGELAKARTQHASLRTPSSCSELGMIVRGIDIG